MKISFILTAFSPAMFGNRATVHLKLISHAEASSLVDGTSRIMANRSVHERLARNQFPQASQELARYADLRPGITAIHVHYRGPTIPDSGEPPAGAAVSFYLIEVDAYQEAAGG